MDSDHNQMTLFVVVSSRNFGEVLSTLHELKQQLASLLSEVRYV